MVGVTHRFGAPHLAVCLHALGRHRDSVAGRCLYDAIDAEFGCDAALHQSRKTPWRQSARQRFVVYGVNCRCDRFAGRLHPFVVHSPLILFVPPLIWGWLTYRVYAFDALADHASRFEREQIFKRHRLNLLIMGVATGYLGAAPSLLWASGAVFIAMAPLFVPLAIWIYTLVFAFSSLWFSHYCLAVLSAMRQTEPVPIDSTVIDVEDVTDLGDPPPQLPKNTLHDA